MLTGKIDYEKILYYIVIFIISVIYFIRIVNKYKISRPYKEKIKKIQDFVKKSDKTLVKDKSNHLFGLKKFKNANKINLSSLCRILDIDTSNNIIELEGSCTIKQVLDALIPKGYMLKIIPDMSHLNMGGIIRCRRWFSII